MGQTRHETYREKIGVAYTLMGIGADVMQLGRAVIRNEKRGVKANIKQIIHKLEKIGGLL